MQYQKLLLKVVEKVSIKKYFEIKKKLFKGTINTQIKHIFLLN